MEPSSPRLSCAGTWQAGRSAQRQTRCWNLRAGEAAFLLAAGERLDTLAALAAEHRGGQDGIKLHGIELHPASARQAEAFVRAAGHDTDVIARDFFLVSPVSRYDAVIGNPPYVRYQDFAGEARARSREAALRAGVPLTRLASSWAAFTVHSALFLKPGGRLGLVLPAELLSVNYAAEVRRFLMQRFARVRLVLFTERVFPGVQEEVVLLLADGYGHGPADHCELQQLPTAADLAGAAPPIRAWKPDPVEGKWTSSLLSTAAREAQLALQRSGLALRRLAVPMAVACSSWSPRRLTSCRFPRLVCCCRLRPR